jgi:hypothetical protein
MLRVCSFNETFSGGNRVGPAGQEIVWSGRARTGASPNP